MSSREPLWFCHECRSEMRPLMVPDPVCASCRGSFVEKMESTTDDPRAFSQPDEFDFAPPPDLSRMLLTMHTLLSGGLADRRPTSSRVEPLAGGASSRAPESRSTYPPQPGHRPSGPSPFAPDGEPPRMHEFLRRGPDASDDGGIAAPLMAQYLMSLLGPRHPLGDIFGMGGSTEGRMGDYVFNQEALDQIITQLMESSNANRPVPATEEVINKLQRDVLEIGSPLLQKDCAVCKEQFSVETTDPEELVVVTLPCQHPFHSPCILPWLKSSGTCPVCRYALVPQPEHHPANQGRTRPAEGPSRPQHAGPGSGSPGIFQSLFNLGSGSSSSSNTPQSSSQSRHNRSNSDPAQGPRAHFPGSWPNQEPDLD